METKRFSSQNLFFIQKLKYLLTHPRINVENFEHYNENPKRSNFIKYIHGFCSSTDLFKLNTFCLQPNYQIWKTFWWRLFPCHPKQYYENVCILAINNNRKYNSERHSVSYTCKFWLFRKFSDAVWIWQFYCNFPLKFTGPAVKVMLWVGRAVD